MAKTFFKPELDSLSGELKLSLESLDLFRIKTLYFKSRNETLNKLRNFFGSATERYSVCRSLNSLISAGEPDISFYSSMAAAVTLDYFYYRRFSPTLKSYKKKRAKKKSAQLEQFIKNRSESNESRENIVTLLYWTTIQQCIPEKWIPEHLLEKPIQRLVENTGLLKEADLEIEMQLPFNGGNKWISEHTRYQWNRLEKKLKNICPWPVRLILNSPDPFAHPVLIAYGYEKPEENKVRIFLYSPLHPGEKFFLDFYVLTDRIDQLTLNSNMPEKLIQGFFCETFTPRKPEVKRYPNWVYYMVPMGIIWRITRWFKSHLGGGSHHLSV